MNRLADGYDVATLGDMAPSLHDIMLRVRMTKAERRMLQRLADKSGLTASDIVRLLVRREYEATFGEALKPKK